MAHSSLEPTGSLDLSARPLLWIRGEERIAPFDRISAIALLEDHSVIMADAGANQVHAFSAEGTYRWSAGRAGDGPGEFRRINFLFATPGDTILVADAQLRRLTLLSATGTLLGVAEFASEVGSPVGLLSSGELLYLNLERMGEPSVGLQHTRATWSAVDLTGTSVRALATTPGSDSFYGQAGGTNLVVRLDLLRRPFVAPMGDGFVFALSDRPEINRYRREGRLVASIRFPGDALSRPIGNAQAVRDDFLDNFDEAMRAVLAEIVADVPIPARWPPIGSLIVDDANRVWVRTHRPDDALEATWHVFTASGQYLDDIVVPRGFTARVIRDGLLAGVWRDELDVQSVRLYRIEGG